MNQQKQQKQLLKDIFTGSCRNHKVPDKILTYTIKFGTFIIIPDVCLIIFPKFLSTEAAFQWCSTKVVDLQKDVMR